MAKSYFKQIEFDKQLRWRTKRLGPGTKKKNREKQEKKMKLIILTRGKRFFCCILFSVSEYIMYENVLYFGYEWYHTFTHSTAHFTENILYLWFMYVRS